MAEVWLVLKRVLGLDPELFASAYVDPMGLLVPALVIALVAAASTMLGHVAILKLNHIGGLRLLSALVLSAVVMAGLQGVGGAGAWVVASVGLREPLPPLPLLI
ncbi:MAG TPA: hypothetical protein PKE42_05655, partial [Arachnia sp.]|nr:hypothetical protein [Arachnia sp.]